MSSRKKRKKKSHTARDDDKCAADAAHADDDVLDAAHTDVAAAGADSSRQVSPRPRDSRRFTERKNNDFSPGWSARYYRQMHKGSRPQEWLPEKPGVINHRKSLCNFKSNDSEFNCLSDSSRRKKTRTFAVSASKIGVNIAHQSNCDACTSKDTVESASATCKLLEHRSSRGVHAEVVKPSNINTMAVKPALSPWPCRKSEQENMQVRDLCLINSHKEKDKFHDMKKFNTERKMGGTQLTYSAHKNESVRNQEVSTHHATKKNESYKPKSKEATSAACQEEATPRDLEIPGFYYDKIKKKYFKILPTANNTVSAVTKETIKHKTQENQRQELVKSLLFEDIPTFKIKSKILQAYPSTWRRSDCSWRTLTGRTYGLVTSSHFQQTFLRQTFSKLKPRTHIKIFEEPSNSFEKLEHMKYLLLTPDGSKYLCVWTLKALLTQRMQMLSVNCDVDATDEREFHLRVNLCDPLIRPTLSKVTSMCWAPTSPADTSARFVLYTTMCMFGNNRDANCAILRDLKPSLSDDCCSSWFGLNSKMTWACAWNARDQTFSVGSEGCCLLFDVQTRRLWELATKNSDVLALKFSDENGHLLYSGIRKGYILMHDLRSSSTFHIAAMKHSSSVSWLHLLADNNYILASDFSSKLCQWDVRMRRVVRDYCGHYDEYARLPFHVDESLQMLYAVGQDCYCRIWDLREGCLLHTIPSPHPAAIDEIPVVSLTTDIPGLRGHPSLLMFVHDELHLYTL